MVTSEIKKKRIIGAGLPRTGTTSLTAALECLGYGPVLHAHKDDEAKAYASLLAAKLQYPDIGAVQLEKITGASLKKLTCPYNATLDSPTADFYVELADLYPESLVILTVRDTDKQWWSSWHSTLGSIFDLDWEGRLRRAVFWAAPNHASRLQMMMNYTLLWQSKYGEYGPQVHKQHNLEVARRIAPDRLLVFNVKEGWSPLCTFLGVKVPSEPFPHSGFPCVHWAEGGSYLAAGEWFPIMVSSGLININQLDHFLKYMPNSENWQKKNGSRYAYT